MGARNKSKYKFVATKVCETIEGKGVLSPTTKNEDFG